MPPHVMFDSSVLIDHFRTKDKESTLFARTVREYDILSISVVAKLEVLYGTRSELVERWNAVFATMQVIPFTNDMVAKSHEIILDLKRKSLLIDMKDIMIAATAIVRDIPIATLNRKHFERVVGLKLIEG